MISGLNGLGIVSRHDAGYDYEIRVYSCVSGAISRTTAKGATDVTGMLTSTVTSQPRCLARRSVKGFCFLFSWPDTLKAGESYLFLTSRPESLV
jgi:hypothetical protein